MFKNVASKITFFVFDSTTGLPKTGDAANLTAYVSKDFGSVTVLADTSATEDDATNAKGNYTFDLAQGETNGDDLKFTCKSATANITCVPRFVATNPNLFSSLAVDSSGRVDVIKVAGTTQTARDLGASVLLSSGTGTGQLDFTSGVVKGNVTQILGTAASTPATAGILEVNVKNWNNLAAVALPLIPTTAGRTLDVSAGGEAGVDWANVGSPTTSLNLSGTTVGTAAALTANNDKTGYSLSTNDSLIVDNGTAQGGGASTITLRAGASATDNLYRGQTIAIKSGTGAGQTRIGTAYVGSTQVLTVDEAWQTAPDNTSVYVLQARRNAKLDSSLQVIAASVTGAVGSVTGAVGSVTGAVGSVTGNVGGNVTGSVGSVVGAVGSVTGNVGGNVTGSVGSLATQAKADVNAEADTALSDVGLTTTITGRIDAAVTTRATPAQVLTQVNAALDAAMTELSGDAGATPTLRQAAQMLYMAVRNKTDQTATTQQVYNSAGSVILTATCSDDGTTAVRGKFS